MFEQKYRVLYENSLDAHLIGEITENRRDLGFVDGNQAALDLLSLTRGKLLAADMVSLSPEHQPDGRLSREKFGELIARCLAKGRLRFDWRLCRADGELLPIEITMTVYHEQAKTFLHAVWRDLSGFTHTPPPKLPAESHKGAKRP